MNKIPFIYKAVAVFTALCLECTSISISLAYAESASKLLPAVKSLSPENLKLPVKFGEVVESHSGNGSVVIIQDAHAIPDAQRNIANVIKYLQKEYGVETVALEGASGDLDPQIFRSFPDKKLLREVMKGYMDAGEIAGGTAAAIFDETATKYVGVEDWDVYEEGLGLYLSATEKEPELSKQLEVYREQLQVEKEKVYPKALLELDRQVEKFYENAGQLTELIKVLGTVKAPAVGSELEALWKEVSKQNQEAGTKNQEFKDIEVRAIAAKVERVLPTPSAVKAFNARKQEWMTGQISAEAFALYLKEAADQANLDIEMSSDLHDMVRDQQTLKGLEGTKLFRDLEIYIKEVKQALISEQATVVASETKQSPEAVAMMAELRDLDSRTESLRLLTKLAKLEIPREEWKQLAGGVIFDSLRLLGLKQEDFVFHLAFYLNAEERDEIFFKNITKDQWGQSKIALSPLVIVAGGFHAEGLTSRLKEAGIGYALVMPKINHIPEDNSYRAQMRGEVSWKDYFEVENGRIHLYKAFVRATRDKLLRRGQSSGLSSVPNASQPDIQILKAWRDQIIRDLSDQGKVQRAAFYTRYMDEVVDQTIDQRLKTTDQLMMKVDNFIRGLRGLEKANQLNSEQIAALLKANMIQAAPIGGALARVGFVPVNVGVEPNRAEEIVMAGLTGEVRHAADLEAPSSNVLDGKNLSELKDFFENKLEVNEDVVIYLSEVLNYKEQSENLNLKNQAIKFSQLTPKEWDDLIVIFGNDKRLKKAAHFLQHWVRKTFSRKSFQLELKGSSAPATRSLSLDEESAFNKILEMNLSAHGVSEDKGGLGGLLQIIFEGKIVPGGNGRVDYATLTSSAAADSHNVSSQKFGPFYVVLKILNQSDQAELLTAGQITNGITENWHGVYLVPGEDYKDYLIQAVDRLVKDGELDSELAENRKNKILTYGEFLTGRDALFPPQDIGKRSEARSEEKSPKISEPINLTSASIRKTFSVLARHLNVRLKGDHDKLIQELVKKSVGIERTAEEILKDIEEKEINRVKDSIELSVEYLIELSVRVNEFALKKNLDRSDLDGSRSMDVVPLFYAMGELKREEALAQLLEGIRDDELRKALSPAIDYLLGVYESNFSKRVLREKREEESKVQFKSRESVLGRITASVLGSDAVGVLFSSGFWFILGSFIGGVTLGAIFAFIGTFLGSLLRGFYLNLNDQNNGVGKEIDFKSMPYGLSGGNNLAKYPSIAKTYRQTEAVLSGHENEPILKLLLLQRVLKEGAEDYDVGPELELVDVLIAAERKRVGRGDSYKILQNERANDVQRHLFEDGFPNHHPFTQIVSSALQLGATAHFEVLEKDRPRSERLKRALLKGVINNLFAHLRIPLQVLRLNELKKRVDQFQARLLFKFQFPISFPVLEPAGDRLGTQRRMIPEKSDQVRVAEVEAYLKGIQVEGLSEIVEYISKNYEIHFNRFIQNDWRLKPPAFSKKSQLEKKKFSDGPGDYEIDVESKVIQLSSEMSIEANAMALVTLAGVAFKHDLIRGDGNIIHIPEAKIVAIRKSLAREIVARIFRNNKEEMKNDLPAYVSRFGGAIVAAMRSRSAKLYSDPNSPGIIFTEKPGVLARSAVSAKEAFLIAFYKTFLNAFIRTTNQDVLSEGDSQITAFEKMKGFFAPLLSNLSSWLALVSHATIFLAVFGGIFLSLDLSFVDASILPSLDFLSDYVGDWIYAITDAYAYLKDVFNSALIMLGFSIESLTQFLASLWTSVLPARLFLQNEVIPILYNLALPTIIFMWGILSGFMIYAGEVKNNVGRKITPLVIYGVTGMITAPLKMAQLPEESLSSAEKSVKRFMVRVIGSHRVVFGSAVYELGRFLSTTVVAFALISISFPFINVQTVFHTIQSFGIPLTPVVFAVFVVFLAGLSFSTIYEKFERFSPWVTTKLGFAKKIQFQVMLISMAIMFVMMPAGSKYVFEGNPLKNPVVSKINEFFYKLIDARDVHLSADGLPERITGNLMKLWTPETGETLDELTAYSFNQVMLEIVAGLSEGETKYFENPFLIKKILLDGQNLPLRHWYWVKADYDYIAHADISVGDWKKILDSMFSIINSDGKLGAESYAEKMAAMDVVRFFLTGKVGKIIFPEQLEDDNGEMVFVIDGERILGFSDTSYAEEHSKLEKVSGGQARVTGGLPVALLHLSSEGEGLVKNTYAKLKKIQDADFSGIRDRDIQAEIDKLIDYGNQSSVSGVLDDLDRLMVGEMNRLILDGAKFQELVESPTHLFRLSVQRIILNELGTAEMRSALEDAVNQQAILYPAQWGGLKAVITAPERMLADIKFALGFHNSGGDGFNALMTQLRMLETAGADDVIAIEKNKLIEQYQLDQGVRSPGIPTEELALFSYGAGLESLVHIIMGEKKPTLRDIRVLKEALDLRGEIAEAQDRIYIREIFDGGSPANLDSWHNSPLNRAANEFISDTLKGISNRGESDQPARSEARTVIESGEYHFETKGGTAISTGLETQKDDRVDGKKQPHLLILDLDKANYVHKGESHLFHALFFSQLFHEFNVNGVARSYKEIQDAIATAKAGLKNAKGLNIYAAQANLEKAQNDKATFLKEVQKQGFEEFLLKGDYGILSRRLYIAVPNEEQRQRVLRSLMLTFAGQDKDSLRSSILKAQEMSGGARYSEADLEAILGEFEKVRSFTFPGGVFHGLSNDAMLKKLREFIQVQAVDSEKLEFNPTGGLGRDISVSYDNEGFHVLEGQTETVVSSRVFSESDEKVPNWGTALESQLRKALAFNDGRMRTVNLGTGDPTDFSGAQDYTHMAFVKNGRFVLADPSIRTIRNLERLGLMDQVSAIQLTHIHYDHVGGLLDLIRRKVKSGESEQPIKLLAPYAAYAQLVDLAALNFGEELRDSIAGVFDFRAPEQIENKVETVQFDGMTFQFGRTHGHPIPTYGVKITNDGITTSYLSDSTMPAQKIKGADGKEIDNPRYKEFVEFFGGTKENPVDMIVAENGVPGVHITPEQLVKAFPKHARLGLIVTVHSAGPQTQKGLIRFMPGVILKPIKFAQRLKEVRANAKELFKSEPIKNFLHLTARQALELAGMGVAVSDFQEGEILIQKGAAVADHDVVIIPLSGEAIIEGPAGINIPPVGPGRILGETALLTKALKQDEAEYKNMMDAIRNDKVSLKFFSDFTYDFVIGNKFYRVINPNVDLQKEAEVLNDSQRAKLTPLFEVSKSGAAIPRTATVRAGKNSSYLLIHKDAFLQFFMRADISKIHPDQKAFYYAVKGMIDENLKVIAERQAERDAFGGGAIGEAEPIAAIEPVVRSEARNNYDGYEALFGSSEDAVPASVTVAEGEVLTLRIPYVESEIEIPGLDHFVWIKMVDGKLYYSTSSRLSTTFYAQNVRADGTGNWQEVEETGFIYVEGLLLSLEADRGNFAVENSSEADIYYFKGEPKSEIIAAYLADFLIATGVRTEAIRILQEGLLEGDLNDVRIDGIYKELLQELINSVTLQKSKLREALSFAILLLKHWFPQQQDSIAQKPIKPVSTEPVVFFDQDVTEILARVTSLQNLAFDTPATEEAAKVFYEATLAVIQEDILEKNNQEYRYNPFNRADALGQAYHVLSNYLFNRFTDLDPLNQKTSLDLIPYPHFFVSILEQFERAFQEVVKQLENPEFALREEKKVYLDHVTKLLLEIDRIVTLYRPVSLDVAVQLASSFDWAAIPNERNYSHLVDSEGTRIPLWAIREIYVGGTRTTPTPFAEIPQDDYDQLEYDRLIRGHEIREFLTSHGLSNGNVIHFSLHDEASLKKLLYRESYVAVTAPYPEDFERKEEGWLTLPNGEPLPRRQDVAAVMVDGIIRKLGDMDETMLAGKDATFFYDSSVFDSYPKTFQIYADEKYEQREFRYSSNVQKMEQTQGWPNSTVQIAKVDTSELLKKLSQAAPKSGYLVHTLDQVIYRFLAERMPSDEEVARNRDKKMVPVLKVQLSNGDFVAFSGVDPLLIHKDARRIQALLGEIKGGLDVQSFELAWVISGGLTNSTSDGVPYDRSDRGVDEFYDWFELYGKATQRLLFEAKQISSSPALSKQGAEDLLREFVASTASIHPSVTGEEIFQIFDSFISHRSFETRMIVTNRMKILIGLAREIKEEVRQQSENGQSPDSVYGIFLKKFKNSDLDLNRFLSPSSRSEARTGQPEGPVSTEDVARATEVLTKVVTFFKEPAKYTSAQISVLADEVKTILEDSDVVSRLSYVEALLRSLAEEVAMIEQGGEQPVAVSAEAEDFALKRSLGLVLSDIQFKGGTVALELEMTPAVIESLKEKITPEFAGLFDVIQLPSNPELRKLFSGIGVIVANHNKNAADAAATDGASKIFRDLMASIDVDGANGTDTPGLTSTRIMYQILIAGFLAGRPDLKEEIEQGNGNDVLAEVNRLLFQVGDGAVGDVVIFKDGKLKINQTALSEFIKTLFEAQRAVAIAA